MSIKSKLFRLFKVLSVAFILKAVAATLGAYLLINYYNSQYFYIAPDLPAYKEYYRPAADHLQPLLHLKVKTSAWQRLIDHRKENQFVCTAFVVDDYYAVTAAHCLIGQATTEFDLTDSENNPLPQKATVAAYNARNDVGLIFGDFRQFNKLPVETHRAILAYSQRRS